MLLGLKRKLAKSESFRELTSSRTAARSDQNPAADLGLSIGLSGQVDCPYQSASVASGNGIHHDDVFAAGSSVATQLARSGQQRERGRFPSGDASRKIDVYGGGCRRAQAVLRACFECGLMKMAELMDRSFDDIATVPMSVLPM